MIHKKEVKNSKKKDSLIKNGNVRELPIKRPSQIPPTFGQKASDTLTKYAGSWGFIIGFLVFLLIWMAINAYGWVHSWDPYPFILLNLVLSCLAAIQAPIILMSQNRAAQKDRQRAEYDYAVNRKSEREIQRIIKQLTRIENRFLKNKD
ncbi:hypothetical protein B6U91_00040 [Candidatus Pacearchaeota archaeon ex4484_71]|nr:MAG: hypothetical protein B6U91_00040 [Candidatus Pacearchaeota archaeon ex4484_71]